MTNKALLEVDESLIRDKLLLTEKKKEDEELNELLRSFDKSDPPSVTFRPFPGVCIKCRTENGDKYFLNICHTDQIPAPVELSEDELQVLLRDETTQNWCIPMSIGHERIESAKDGAECLTCDIAVNTKFFQQCENSKTFMYFTISATMSAVSEKHQKTFYEDFKILKNRKVLGKLHDHRAQKREPKKPTVKKPLIEEITASSKISYGSNSQQIREKKDVNVGAEYVLLRKLEDGKIEKLFGYFKLPDRVRMRDIRVDVSDDRIIVEAPRMNYLVDIFLPLTLDQDKVTAAMDENLKILRLNIPIM